MSAVLVPLDPKLQPDFFETREQRKARLFAAAKRWAVRLPGETGDDHRRTYDRMIGSLLGALRA